MPYIVPSPSSPSSTVSGKVTPPHSPSRPPLALSIAFASPAPVPPHTPFTPPMSLDSSQIVMCPSTNFQSLISTANDVFGHQHPSSYPPPLVKALSDSKASTSASASSPYSMEKTTSCSPPLRRASSTSSASGAPSTYRNINAAGSSLLHAPRRRSGSVNSPDVCEEQSNQISTSQSSTPTRGRSRSRFLLGSEEESGSGSSEECMRVQANLIEIGGKETKGHMEERVSSKQPTSVEHSLRKTRPSFTPPSVTLDFFSESSASDSESSECATPTQSKKVKSHQCHDIVSRLVAEEHNHKNTDNVDVNMPIARRSHRGRGRKGARKQIFGSDSEGEISQQKGETSIIAFPSSKSSSPPPCIAVKAPTPEMTPTQLTGSPKSFSGKRVNAGSLRLDLGGCTAQQDAVKVEASQARENMGALSSSTSLNSMSFIRKKSGEIVRPSLKSRSSSVSSARQRPSLSLGDISSIANNSPSISAPTTPATAKMVHFDAQLERVKVFKSTSKPAAVSRDGSPTYDDTTSGGEGDSASEGPPHFIPRPRPKRLVPGGTTVEEEEAVRRVLMMRVLNMPHRDVTTDGVDVRLERLYLAEDAASVQGIVRVRNIAFEKSVAVRFTFDGWQTTSEVLGQWVESCIPHNSSLPASKSEPAPLSRTEEKYHESPVPIFDRFTFSIRLADLLLRIDEKTLVLAVRYCSAGREMWDNNDGQNYRAVFEQRPQHSLSLAGSAVVPPSPDSAKDKTRDNETGRRGGGAGGSSSNTSGSGEIRASPLRPNMLSALDKAVCEIKDGRPLSPSKKASDLAARYDLDSSLKNPLTWRPRLDQLHTWAGRDHASSRARIPWARESSPTHQQSGKFVADFFNSHQSESHRMNLKTRGLSFGSPRDLDRGTLKDSAVERFSQTSFAASEDVTAPEGTLMPRFHGGANRSASPPTSFAPSAPDSESRIRNHHRSYFDSWVATGHPTSTFGSGKARLTPPGTPKPLDHRTLSDPVVDALAFSGVSSVTPVPEEAMVSGRTHSFPPLRLSANKTVAAGLGLITAYPWMDSSRGSELGTGDSEASTPSITTVSSPTTTVSPSPPEFQAMVPASHSTKNAHPGSSVTDSNSYNAFLNSFCFYRGMHGYPNSPVSDVRRIHSASEVEALLSTPPPSASEAFPLLKGYTAIPPGSDSRASNPTISSEAMSPGMMSPFSPPTSAGLLETEIGQSTSVRG